MTSGYEELRSEISDMICPAGERGSLGSTEVGKIRDFLSCCEDRLAPGDCGDEEQELFRKLSALLIDGRNMDSLGRKEYFRINADLYRVMNKLESEKKLETKLFYLSFTVQYADAAAADRQIHLPRPRGQRFPCADSRL